MSNTPKKAHETIALHASDGGDNHLVGLGGLRVLLMEDSGCWFAQGLEIDYAAAGATIDEVKENFGKGLAATIREHLIMHGGFEKLLQIAPPDVWKEAFQSHVTLSKYSTIQFHAFGLSEKEAEGTNFPFKKIVFVEPEPVPA